MTTNAKIGHGTLFALFDAAASPAGYVTLAEVTNITPPSLARDTVEATHTESPEKWREHIPGLKDAGEVSIEMNLVPGGAAVDLLLAAFNSDDLQLGRITFPDSPATVWSFSGYITAFAPEAPVADKMTAKVTFKLSGKPGFVPAVA